MARSSSRGPPSWSLRRSRRYGQRWRPYGADPDLIEDARIRPVVQDTYESLRQQWEGIKVRLWLDVETGLVRRMAFGLGILQAGSG